MQDAVVTDRVDPRPGLLPRDHWAYPLLGVLVGVVFVLRTAPSVGTFNHTVDEIYHLGSAALLYQDHRHSGDIAHPPLARLVAGLPLWARGWRHLPLPTDPRAVQNITVARRAGDALLFDGPGYWTVLRSARLAMLTFPLVGLLYAYLLGRWIGGGRAGLLAAAVVSVEPTLLGHAFWVCTDAAAVAGTLAILYHGLRYLARPTAAAGAAVGLAVGLGLAAKFSCVFALGGLAAAAVLGVVPPMAAARRAVDGSARRRFTVGHGAIALGLAFAVLWAAYFFEVGRLGDQRLFTDGPIWNHLPRLARRLPIPMPTFALGWMVLLEHGRTGHSAYLNGHLSKLGWKLYFPEAIALKEPLALLAMVAVAVVPLAMLLRSARRRPEAWRPLTVAITAAVILLACITGHIDIGLRHALPAIACGLVAAVGVLTASRWGTALVLVLTGVAVVETAPYRPDYLSYFNVAAGGPRGADRYLVDSNLDWGQDLKRLADYLHSPPAAGRPYTIRVFETGAARAGQAMGLDAEAFTREPSGLFAISQSTRRGLTGYAVDPQGRVSYGPDYRWLDAHTPVARIGNSIEVYDLGPTTRPAAVSRPGPAVRPALPGAAPATGSAGPE